MATKTTYTRTVHPSEVDSSLRASIVSSISYILDTAGNDADAKGFGVKDINAENHSWVLSRMSIDLYRLPDKYEKIHITTWVNDYGRIVTTRNFTVEDENNRRIFAAITQWAMIDLTTRQALDLRTVDEYGQHLHNEPSPIDNPQKIASINPEQTACHKVVYSDIDFNGHVNSLRYLILMFDLLPVETLMNLKPVHIEVNFLHESQYGDTLIVGYEQCNSTWIFEIKNQNNIAICRASIKWEN
jgi:acyl-ACP thioesterase